MPLRAKHVSYLIKSKIRYMHTKPVLAVVKRKLRNIHMKHLSVLIKCKMKYMYTKHVFAPVKRKISYMHIYFYIFYIGPGYV